MTTKKDLVEAHAFSRRRLVTAFLSGAPGGREVEPSRPGRTIFGGVALAVLLIAGAAVASVFAPRTPEGWSAQGLVVTEDGTRYVVTKEDEPLRPIANLTSAQLILGLNPEATLVSQETVDKETPGETIGIEGAPEVLPDKGDFIDSGWTACTASGQGVAVSIDSDPDVQPGAGAGLLVRSGGQEWLIAQGESGAGEPQAYRYRLGSGSSAVQQAIFGSALPPDPVQVSQSWLALFPAGAEPLGRSGFNYEGYGQKSDLAGSSGVPAETRVGDVGEYQGGYYLVAKDGWDRLTPFQAAVYLNTRVDGSTPAQRTFEALPPDETQIDFPETNWPTNLLTPAEGPLCAQLEVPALGGTRVQIATSPGDRSWPAADPPARRQVEQRVEPGKGAFVFSGNTSTPYIVDSLGRAFLLDGPRTLATLGLTTEDGPVVPDAWVEILGEGRPLSTDLALCPPRTRELTDDAQCAPLE